MLLEKVHIQLNLVDVLFATAKLGTEEMMEKRLHEEEEESLR